MPFSTYQQGRIGSVTISPTRGLVAGAHEEISITYTAGHRAASSWMAHHDAIL